MTVSQVATMLTKVAIRKSRVRIRQGAYWVIVAVALLVAFVQSSWEEMSDHLSFRIYHLGTAIRAFYVRFKQFTAYQVPRPTVVDLTVLLMLVQVVGNAPHIVGKLIAPLTTVGGATDGITGIDRGNVIGMLLNRNWSDQSWQVGRRVCQAGVLSERR